MKATEREKEKFKEYYQKNKEFLKQKAKLKYIKNKDEINRKLRITRKNNRKRFRLYELKAKKKWRAKNRSSLLKIENIRRKTVRLFPFNNIDCEICKLRKATQRHHNTLPYQFDKFVFICQPCHLIEDKKLLGDKNAYMER